MHLNVRWIIGKSLALHIFRIELCNMQNSNQYHYRCLLSLRTCQKWITLFSTNNTIRCSFIYRKCFPLHFLFSWFYGGTDSFRGWTVYICHFFRQRMYNYYEIVSTFIFDKTTKLNEWLRPSQMTIIYKPFFVLYIDFNYELLVYNIITYYAHCRHIQRETISEMVASLRGMSQYEKITIF